MKSLDFRVGDLVTGYHKGYWCVTNIEDRGIDAPLVTYILIADSQFKMNRTKWDLLKTKKQQCDSGYCKKVTKEDLEKIRDEFYVNRINELIEFMDELSEII